MTREMMENFRSLLVETGRISENSRLKFVEVTGSQNSDLRTVVFEVYRKRCRKPYMVWELKTDVAREIVHFDRSNFYYC